MSFIPTLLHKIIKAIVVFALAVSCSACLTFFKKEPIIEPFVETPAPEISNFSVAAIKKPKRSTMLFAQSALKKLNYPVGVVDGIWGKQSAAALIAFEQNNDLFSTGGYLSELNLKSLEKESGLTPKTFIPKKVNKPKNIDQLVNVTADLDKSPQLIILEKQYIMMSKANPYSTKLASLTPGTGVYVIDRLDDWYQIETLGRKAGFVKVD